MRCRRADFLLVRRRVGSFVFFHSTRFAVFIHSSFHKSGVRRAAFCALLLCNAVHSYAAPRTWSGPSGGDWGTAANWTPSGVPTTSDDVTIPASNSVSISADAAANKLTIQGGVVLENGTLTLCELDCQTGGSFKGDGASGTGGGTTKFTGNTTNTVGSACTFANVAVDTGCSLTVNAGADFTVKKNLVNNGLFTVSIQHSSGADFIVGGKYSGSGRFIVDGSSKTNEVKFKGDVDFSSGAADAEMNGKKASLCGNSTLSSTQKMKINPNGTTFDALEFNSVAVLIEESTGLLKASDFVVTSGTVAVRALVEAQTITHPSAGPLTFTKNVKVSQTFEDAPTSGALSFQGGAEFTFTSLAEFKTSQPVTLEGACSFAGGMKRSGGATTLGGTLSTPNEKIEFSDAAATITLSAPSTVKSGKGDIQFEGQITTGAHDLTVETTPYEISTALGRNLLPQPAFNGGFAGEATLLLKGNGIIKGSNTFASFRVDNSHADVDTTVTFEAGKRQTIKNAFGTGNIDFKGTRDNRLLLQSSARTGTDSDRWEVHFPNKPQEDGRNFSFVSIIHARAVNSAGADDELKIKQSLAHALDDDYAHPSSTVFIGEKTPPCDFVWRGTYSNRWNDPANWLDANGNTLTSAPRTDATQHFSRILINTELGGHDLDIGASFGDYKELKLKVLIVGNGKRIALGSCKINVNGYIHNDGTIALYGNQTASGPMVLHEPFHGIYVIHGNDSAIEYYGDVDGKDVCAQVMQSSVYKYKRLIVKKPLGRTMTFEHSIDASSFDASQMKGAIVFKAGAVKTSGEQTYSGTVRLEEDTTLTAQNAKITVNATVRGQKSLTVTGASSTIINTDDITTDGAQTYDCPVELAKDARLTASNVMFKKTLDGTKGLTIAGATSQKFKGNVGSAEPLAYLKTSAGETTLGGSGSSSILVKTTTYQAYKGEVTLDSDATLETVSSAAIAFEDEVKSGSNAHSLAITGNAKIHFKNKVGEGTPSLNALTTGANATTKISAAQITTSGVQTYGGAVTLDADATLTASAVTFTSTLDDSNANTHALTIAGGARQTFNGAVGGTEALKTLTTGTGLSTINGGSVKTTGEQRYKGAVQLGSDATLTGALVTFASTVNGAGFLKTVGNAVAINGGSVKTKNAQNYGGAVELGADTTIETENKAAVTFNGTVNSDNAGSDEHALRIDGKAQAEFKADVGLGTKGLTSLTTGADTQTAIHTAQIKTSGAQNYGGAVTITADATLTATAMTFERTLDGPKSLTIAGSAPHTFNGAVGSAAALSSLTTGTGLSSINGGSVKTSGAQTYGGKVELGASTTIEAETAAAVTFTGTVNSKTGGADDYALTIAGKAQAEFQAEVGGVTPGIASLTTGADTQTAINTAQIKTSGAQTYGGALTLPADATLTASLVTFTKTVDGPKSLTIAGAAPQTFGGAVGGQIALSSLKTSTGESVITGGLVKTTGNQTYQGRVTASENELTAETGATAYFQAGFADDAKLLLKGNAEITGGNIFSSFKVDNSQAAAGTTVKFEGGKRQIIKNAFGASAVDFKGKDAANRLVLGALGPGKWDVYFQNKPKYKNFSFVSILDSKSVDMAGTAANPLLLPQLAAHIKDYSYQPKTTDDWFSYKFVWRGAVDTTWAETGNWRFAEADAEPDTAPQYSGFIDEITIDTAAGGHDLDLVNGLGSPLMDRLELKALTVKAGKRIGIGSCKIRVTDAIKNDGTLALYGNQTGSPPILLSDSNQITHTAGSAIEYYGSVNGSDVLAVSMPSSPAAYTYYKVKVTKTGGGKMTFSRAVRADELDASATTAPAGVRISGGRVTTIGAQTYGGATELGADATLTGAAVKFTGTLDGAHALTMAGATPLTFGGAVGSAAALTTLTTSTGVCAINGGSVKTAGVQTYGGAVTLNADATLTASLVTFTAPVNGTQSLTIAGPAALNGGAVTTAKKQTYNGAVQLGANATLTGSLVTFAGTLDGAHSLTMAGATAQTFGGIVGGAAPLSSLATGSGISTISGGRIKTEGAQTYRGAVELGAHATIETISASPVTFEDAVDSVSAAEYALTVLGKAQPEFKGDVGFGAKGLSALNTGADTQTSINTARMKTSGAQTYGGSVLVKKNATLTATLVTFAGTLDGGRALTMAGATAQTFDGVVGGAEPLASLTAGAGASAINGGLIKTSGAQTYHGAVLLGKNAVIETLSASPVTFEGTVNSAGPAEYALSVGGKAQPEFKGDVGFGAKGLSALNTGAETEAALNTAQIKTAGAQTYGGSVRMKRNATLTATLVTFAGTLDGGHALTMAGATAQTFGGVVGGANPLASLTTGTGLSSINGGSVKTSGGQTYKGAVQLGSDATLTASLVTFMAPVNGTQSLTIAGATAINGGAVTTAKKQTYNGAVQLGANATLTGSLVTFAGTLDGAYALTMAGATAQTFGGAVGGANPLTSLTTGTGLSSINGGSVKTTGVQTYKGAAQLGSDAALTGSLVTFAGTLDGAYALTMTGATAQTFGGAVGGATALASLTTGTGLSSINGGLIKTAGTQTYSGQVALGSDATLRASEADDGGAIRFKALLKDNGKHALTVETLKSYVVLHECSFATGGAQLFKASRGVRLLAAADGVWSAGEGGITLDAETTDLYAGCMGDAVKVTLGSDMSCRNFYFYRGKLSCSGRKIRTADDFAVWGAAYNADDPRYSGADARFAFFMEPSSDLRALLAVSLTLAPAYGASFENISSAEFTVGRNFYINGADLNAASLSLKLRDNGSSKPVFNASAAVTERQWGVPYAALFNMTAKNVKASHWVAAGGAQIQNVTDGGGNEKLQFASPKLTAARTVYDDVVHIKFDADVENSNGEIASALAFGKNALKDGGVWYNGASLSMGAAAYADADCAKPLANRDIPAADGFYLKIKADSGTWNTDATGAFAYRADSTNPSDSADRSGRHREVKVDLSFLEGVFTAAYGHTMCRNYGIGLEGGAPAAPFTKVSDGCAPVLLEVRTGQELHVAPSGAANMHNYNADAQKPYDAHNFIEFRYSEPVNTGMISLNDRADERKTINVQVTEAFGSLNGSAPLKAAGIAEMKGGAAPSSGATIHSLYRKFSRDGIAAPAFESHRLRLSVAGFADKTVSVGGRSYYNWAGYIDGAETPQGNVTPIGGKAVSDAAGNSIDGAGAKNHALPPLQVNAREEGTFGLWDVQPPAFAAFGEQKKNGKGGYEAVGNAAEGAAGLERMEFHLFDNAENAAAWYIKFGWSKDGGKTLFAPDAYGADIFGGARPFAESARRTSGGIRYSTLYNKAPYFKYAAGTAGAPEIPCRDEIVAGAKSPIFLPAEGSSRRAMTAHDGLYFSVTLADDSLPFKSVLAVSYDEGGCITDLAGNRMKTQKILTVDRTPPSFSMTVGAVRDNAGASGIFKELYIVFNKPLKESKIPDMYKSLRFVKNTPPYSVQGDLKAVSSRLKFLSETQTGIIVTLSRSLTLQDMLETYVQCHVEKASEDPVSGILGALVSEIQDDLGNYLPHRSAHALSDFAVNAVDAIYAYDGRQAADAGESADLSRGLAVRNWDADAGQESTLMTEQDIFIYAQMRSGDADGDSVSRKVEAHFDVVSKIDPKALSENYNRNKSGVADWRIWLPGTSFKTKVLPFSALSKAVNEKNPSMLQSSATYKGDGKPFSFTAPYEGAAGMNSKGAGWKSGDQISFLFGLADKDGNPLTIVHAPEWDGSAYAGSASPLFALRLRSGGDLSDIDLWSFNLRERIRQRGGVSIQGNVIDRTGGGKAMIEVETSGSGDLDVIVLTLDGDVVRYLHHGQCDGGRKYFSWDGRSVSGKPVARGLYFVRVFGNGIDETRKIMVVGE